MRARRRAAPVDGGGDTMTAEARYAPGLERMLVRIDELIPDPANARLHGTANMRAIRSSLARFGQRTPIVAQRTNDGALIIRKGNGTTEAASGLGWTHIACIVIDEDDATATAYAIADNRTGDLAVWDDDVLMRTLQSLSDDDELFDATGFTVGQLEAMGDDDEHDEHSEWNDGGMPDFENDDVGVKKLVVHFRTEDDVQRFAKLIGQPLTMKTLSVWYPADERDDLSDVSWEGEAG